MLEEDVERCCENTENGDSKKKMNFRIGLI